MRLTIRICLALTFALTGAKLAQSAAISWDDAGNSPSKLWSDFGNWSPDGSPAADDISIGNLANAANDVTLVDQDFSIQSLDITNGAEVVNSTDSGATSENQLVVNGPTTISGTGSAIRIYGGTPDGLDTDSLTINSGATLQLNSQTAVGLATVEVDNGVLDVNLGGTLSGNGTIELIDAPAAPTPLLINDGTISAGAIGFFLISPATTLRFTGTSANAEVDLDGAGNGVVNVNRNATLDVDLPLADSMSGVFNLSDGATLDVSAPWTLDTGTINVNTPGIILGSPGSAANIVGGAISMTGGSIVLDTAGIDRLTISASLTTTGGTINNHGLLIFNQAATIGSGTDFQMNGDEASITVNEGFQVLIDDASFNLDGTGFATNVTTIHNNAILDIDLDFDAADDVIGHTIVLNGGQLDISNINGTSTDKVWNLGASSVVNVNAATAFSRLDGSDLEVAGTINIVSGATLAMDTTAAELISSAKVNMAGGELTGTATITIGNTSGIEGTGTVRSQLINNTEIEANGGTLTVNTSGDDNDWDGTAGNGTLRATNGTLEMHDSASFGFTGALRATAGTLSTNGFGFNLNPGSTITLSNGSVLRSTHSTGMDGALTVSGAAASTTQVAATLTFENGSSTTLNSNLRLDNTVTVIQTGATFSGGSSLVNLAGKTLRLNDTADVDVIVQNQGRMEIGTTQARVDGLDFQQDATGILEIELAGTGLANFDRYILSGQALLGGALEVDLLGGFVPALGDTFRFLSASSISNTFASLDLPALGAGLAWSVNYQPTFVELAIAAGGLQCDLNGDGAADAADAGIMFANWGGAGSGDCNNDGIVDAADAGVLFAEWTGDAAPPATVPEPTSLSGLLLVGLAVLRKRRTV